MLISSTHERAILYVYALLCKRSIYTILRWTYPQDLQILHLTAMQTACFNACLYSSPVFGEILQKVLELSETQGNNGTIKTEIEYFKKYSYKNSITDHSNIGKLIFQGL